MISVYTFAKSKLQVKDARSLSELEEIAKETEWSWIDCAEPSDEELLTIAKFLKEDNIINIIKTKQMLSQYERINDHVLIPSILVDFREKLETYPIYIFTNERSLVTVRNENAQKPIKNTIRTFQDCVKKLKCETSSSFVISRLFHEITNENLNTTMMLRSRIAEIEEEVLEKPASKKIDRAVFKLKREIAALERILWTQKEVMLAIDEGVVPTIESSKMDKSTLNHAIDNISRELSLISAHNDALDSVLSVRGLGMIHRVETILVLFAVLTLVADAIMVLLEFGVLHFAL
jgi:Mg2+ and Co2+ transporter CorA